MDAFSEASNVPSCDCICMEDRWMMMLSLWLVTLCGVQNSQGSMVNAMAFPAGPESENQRRPELSSHHPAWDRFDHNVFSSQFKKE